MADFQYEFDRADPIYGLRQSMHRMNGQPQPFFASSGADICFFVSSRQHT
jgi:hypothetical protein